MIKTIGTLLNWVLEMFLSLPAGHFHGLLRVHSCQTRLRLSLKFWPIFFIKFVLIKKLQALVLQWLFSCRKSQLPACWIPSLTLKTRQLCGRSIAPWVVNRLATARAQGNLLTWNSATKPEEYGAFLNQISNGREYAFKKAAQIHIWLNKGNIRKLTLFWGKLMTSNFRLTGGGKWGWQTFISQLAWSSCQYCLLSSPKWLIS